MTSAGCRVWWAPARSRSGETSPALVFAIDESDGSPDEKEGRPKHQPPGYQACMMRGEMWPRRQERVSRLTQAHRAVPSWWALLRVGAWCSCWAPQPRGGIFSSGPTLVCRGSVLKVYAPPIQMKPSNELGRTFNGPRADHHPFLCAHFRPDRQHRRRYRPTSTSRSTRIWPPFPWTTILDTRVRNAENLGPAPAPLVLAQVQCDTRRSAASRHPSPWRGAATNM